MTKPKVSIIVPTFRRAEVLKDTLTILTTLSYPKDDYEIIVVDDGSGDSTPEVVKAFQNDAVLRVIYHCQENSGVARARNEGARMAKGDVLIFNDDDIAVEPDVIQRHLKRLSEFDKSLVSGHWEFTPELMKFMRETPFGQYRLALENLYKEENKKELISGNCYRAQTLPPGNASMRREDFWEIGGFDEDFPYAGCEDDEFLVRAVKAGYKFIYDYDIKLLNNDRRIEIEGFAERSRRGAVTKILIAHKFPEERGTHPLIYENDYRKPGEPLKRTTKKIFKSLLSATGAASLLLAGTKFLERNWKDSSLLPRLYNAVCGIYIFRGIRQGIEQYGEPVTDGKDK